jgi:hypothetical protein
MVVVCKTATTDTTGPPFEFRLEVTIDNGTNWKRVGALTTTLQKTGVYSSPVGLVDIATEQYASADIDIRCVVTWDATTNTSDPAVMVFLANRQAKLDVDNP